MLDEYYDYWEDQESGWDTYLVTMTDAITGRQAGPPWPVYAQTFEDAITIYQILIRMQMEQ